MNLYVVLLLYIHVYKCYLFCLPFAIYYFSDEESPVSLVKLHVIADKEDGWIQVVTSIVNVIPLDDPFGPSAITILLDDCPLPSKESVVKVNDIIIETKHIIHCQCVLITCLCSNHITTPMVDISAMKLLHIRLTLPYLKLNGITALKLAMSSDKAQHI